MLAEYRVAASRWYINPSRKRVWAVFRKDSWADFWWKTAADRFDTLEEAELICRKLQDLERRNG